MLRGHAGVPAHVLVLTTHGAQRRRGLGLTRRKARKPRSAASPPPPATGATARATIVRAEPFASIAAAEAWRAGVDPAAEALAAVRVLNRVLHAQRTAAADPSVREVALAAALAVRVGVGLGDQVAHGLWTGAVELPRAAGAARGERSAAALRPQERLAAILGGRDVALACEELTLRARLDLDAGRTREAALQLRVALESALAELSPWGGHERLRRRLEALRDERPTVAAAANSAVEGGLDEVTAEAVARVLGLLEGALLARTEVGLE